MTKEQRDNFEGKVWNEIMKQMRTLPIEEKIAVSLHLTKAFSNYINALVTIYNEAKGEIK